MIGSSFQSSSKTRHIPYKSIWYLHLLMFYLQLNGEAALRRRKVCGKPRTVFELLQESVNPLGYRFEESARSVLGTQSPKAFDDFGLKCKDGVGRERFSIFHVFDGDRRVQIALNELTLASGVFIVINDPTRKCRRIEKHQ